MSFTASGQQLQMQHSESPMSCRQEECGGCHHHLVSRESLQLLDLAPEGKGCILPIKSNNKISSEESTIALTECSSRSSLQDLDLSFEDASPSPAAFGYWMQEEDEVDDENVSKHRHDFLPSVLRKPLQAPRTVSFSSVEEVFGGDEEQQSPGIRPPKTPSIDWYASRGSPPKIHNHRSPVPVFSSSPLRIPSSLRPQPRRSALKKSDARTCDSSPQFQFPSLQYPSSPKLTWYSSKK